MYKLMRPNRLLFLLSLFVCFAISAQDELPLNIDNSKIKPLQKLLDSSLQTNLRDELASHPDWNDLIVQKKMAVGLVDLSDPENVRFARVNGNHMMYAASLPKIAILLAAMDAIEKGELKETSEVKKDMRLMISKSDNSAATRMIDGVGYDKIEAVMIDPKYAFYDEHKGGGLWVGKRYGSGGDTNREPLKNLSHAASVTQVCRYYYLLANGKLVNQKRSKQMLDIMEDPELHHKFVNTLDQIAPAARLFRKSGSWRTYHSDSILVWGKNSNRRYILVALIDDANGEQIIRDLVKPIEKVLKKPVL
ncbi:beta-lactamase class A [Maribacter orientalis]|uniref:beta-lactamase n=1 Tax=Maribacter orientalis TaxID=228957 RepID=A0A1H7NDY6_9FLAO|nr:serine hydrolase [Maribacter orientalis]SEL21710.1 beta-lactamase class A [Maribacter orientalis]|tara:strand:- start:1122 stop:2039 length:918 start_codon:yes stop_codon:yes gene_type:complete